MSHIYAHAVFPRLYPHQRVFVVPGLFVPSNATVAPTAAQDAQLVEKWAGYMQWITIEPRIIGIFP